MLDVLEIIFFLFTILLNWRMCICLAGAVGCGILLVHQFPDQPWTWVAFTVLVITGALIGYVWEQCADAKAS